MFRSSGGPETFNTPIRGNKNYGERLVLCYLYDEEIKGYVLKWALSGDNNYSNENTLDITNRKIIQAEPNISQLSETFREYTPDIVSDATRLGGKRQKKSRTTRRKSGGKRRSRRAKRAIMIRHK